MKFDASELTMFNHILMKLEIKYDKITITPDELAHETGLSGTHVRRLCQGGAIQGRKLGDRWIIPIESAARFICGEVEED